MKEIGRRVGLGAPIVAALQLACGSGDGGFVRTGVMPAPATCGTVLPCAGDLTGTWTVLGGCIPPAGLNNPVCPEATTQLVTLNYAGTVTFNADATYTATNFIENRYEIDTTPMSCSGQTCADEYAGLKSQIGGGLVSYASCVGSSTCTCSVGGRINLIGNSGTYSGQENGIYFVYTRPSGATDSYGPYSSCVQGNLLHLLTTSTIVDSSGAATTIVDEDIVLQKE